MKKSQLRNIIRESIKELITEQVSCNTLQSWYDGSNWQQSPAGCHSFEILSSPPGSPPAGSPGNCSGNLSRIYNHNAPDFLGGNPNVMAAGIGTSTMFYQWFGNPVIGEVVKWKTTSQYGNVITHYAVYRGIDPSVNLGTWGYLQHYDPQRTGVDCMGNQVDYGWNCEQKGDHPKFGHHCVPGNSQNQGQFTTKQDCDSTAPCITLHKDFEKVLDVPFSGSPATTDPQSMTKPEDDLVVIWPSKSEDPEIDPIDPIGPAGPVAPPVQSKITGGKMRCCGNGQCDVGCTGDLCDTVGGKWTCLAPPEDDDVRRMQQLAKIKKL
jgi:hypothetical protein